MTAEPIPALDDSARMQAVDKRNMLRLINELPEQCETALGIMRSLVIDALEEQPNGVFITGIGDSGLAADMAAAILAEETEVPVISDHGGRLPKWIGDGSIVIVVDYGGKSQSEIRNLREAKQRGAKVICITTGGKLMEAASREEVKLVKIPPSQPHRSAIGYLFVPIVVVVEKLGLAEGQSEKLSHAIKLMKNVREALRFENPSKRNPAKQIAGSLMGKLVTVYGASGYKAAVARRWKSQINANSKVAAFDSSVLSLSSGDISGWEFASERASEFGMVFLRDPMDRGETAELMSASEGVLQQFGVVQVDIQGNTTTEKVLYGVYMGDFVSYYIALLNMTDPSTTENVALLEAKLAGEDEAEKPIQ